MRRTVAAAVMAGCTALPHGKVVVSDVTANSLAIDANALYWAADDGTIVKLPLDGSGQPVTLATSPGARALHLAVDASYAYFDEIREGMPTLWRVPLAGGDPVQLASLGGPLAIAGPTLFVVQTDLYSLPIGGGTPTLVVAGHPGANDPMESVAADATNVYATDHMGGLFIVPLAGGPARSAAPCGNHSIASPGAYFVYCVQNNNAELSDDSAPGFIQQTWWEGAQATTRISNEVAPDEIVVDGDQLYWTNRSQVVRGDAQGGHKHVVADNQGPPLALAVGALDVFWSTGPVGSEGPTIRTAPK